MKLIVKKDCLLLEYLYQNINNSKNNIKTILKNGLFVNNIKTTKYDYPLKKDDIIEIYDKITDNLSIIYEDDDFIVIDKPSGILTVATLKEKENTLYHLVLEYVKKKKQKIFIVHRLDKETSGVIIFAKNEQLKLLLQKNWDKYTRKYIAVVNGTLKKEGVFKQYLTENSNHLVYSTNAKNGKLALTIYKLIKANKGLSLVDIEIKTGRKNQIRVAFKDNGTPIVGDQKYGAGRASRVYLHAHKIYLINPLNNKKMCFEAKIPEEFQKVMGG